MAENDTTGQGGGLGALIGKALLTLATHAQGLLSDEDFRLLASPDRVARERVARRVRKALEAGGLQTDDARRKRLLAAVSFAATTGDVRPLRAAHDEARSHLSWKGVSMTLNLGDTKVTSPVIVSDAPHLTDGTATPAAKVEITDDSEKA